MGVAAFDPLETQEEAPKSTEPTLKSKETSYWRRRKAKKLDAKKPTMHTINLKRKLKFHSPKSHKAIGSPNVTKRRRDGSLTIDLLPISHDSISFPKTSNARQKEIVTRLWAKLQSRSKEQYNCHLENKTRPISRSKQSKRTSAPPTEDVKSREPHTSHWKKNRNLAASYNLGTQPLDFNGTSESENLRSILSLISSSAKRRHSISKPMLTAFYKFKSKVRRIWKRII